MTVELRATILKLLDVDTISQQFEADVYVQCKWEELDLDGLSNEVLHMYTRWYESLWCCIDRLMKEYIDRVCKTYYLHID